ncbi:invasion associated locus B family protein [Roseobacter sinensis]|uniref:Invasion associated locus B family protein n=1 Tax=Roseobacter sinensis TaxID=2931391 RepID=A0ABT3BCI8_9RHOB|nr:invasion associated locus B family protein [Roseobacter sp. WL0113]MCV3270848.1 invasion associated locus B family protein [Roseobacter sp. WL0113]
MPKLMSFPLAGAALAVPLAFAASLALAQTETTEETPAQPAEEQQAPGPADELSLGEQASNEPQVGQPYITETFGDWSLRCIKTESGEDPCQMYQLLEDGEGAPISEFTLFRLPDGGQAKAGATIVVPLETSLQAQLTMQIDNQPARRYPFAFCNNVGCYARIGLTEDDVNAFKRGNEAMLTIVPVLAPDQKVDIVLSLSGFTAGYEKASVIQQ